MTMTLAHSLRLEQLLRVLPQPVHDALDAWSSRVARRRLQERGTAAHSAAKLAPIPYKLRPWRD